jgi:FADH2 O2-dependent halogenase
MLLEELATRYDLPRLLPLAKWGTWQKSYPEIACGLKRGFTFFHHKAGQTWAPHPERANELLVAASPHDAIADTHWYRADFDHFLVREAQAAGVEYLDHSHLQTASTTDHGMELTGHRLGEPLTIRAQLVLDASGPRGFLHRALNLTDGSHRGDEVDFQEHNQRGLSSAAIEAQPAAMRFSLSPRERAGVRGKEPLPRRESTDSQPTQALYTHFSGVKRWADLFPSSSAPPYPVDDAALHHIFEGGWIWVLRFNNGLTSAGVAASSALANELRLHEGASAWSRLLHRFPSIREQFIDAIPQLPFAYLSTLCFRSAEVAGPNWALLPSAAGFIDPILSTGFPLTLLGISRVAEILEHDWGTPRVSESLENYVQTTGAELDLVEQFVDALYRHFDDFELFTALTLLYFAAASFTETVRRLGHPERAGSRFLLGAHPSFGPRLRDCLSHACQPLNSRERRNLITAIHEAIAPIDIAGLNDRKRRNHYPVLARDLLENALKLDANDKELVMLLKRCGITK